MRIGHLLCLLVLAAVSCAQDTNFAVGPQYLVTSDATLFLRPIATPSLSLSEPLPSTPEPFPPIRGVSSEGVTVAETPSEPVRLSSQEFFARVYWGEHTPDEVTARFIVTPTLSLSEQPAIPSVMEMNEEAAQRTPAEPEREATGRIEISLARRPSSSGVVQVGVTGTTDARRLSEGGYGVTMGQAASSARNKPHATRFFTNRDIERLHADSR
jgi:hypothetical protein